MSDTSPHEITQLLQAASKGNAEAVEMLAPLVYGELHRLAEFALRKEGVGHTLQPTALVHEAFLVLLGEQAPTWQDRTHFFSLAARLMRRILVDHARRRHAAKRDGGVRITLDEALHTPAGQDADRALDLIAIDEAMTRLEALSERPARVVELRFFAGLDVEETARALAISPASVKRDWTFARAFLLRELATDAAGS